jgi:putative tryptophan/tyrosine transport system substrate-binding protein
MRRREFITLLGGAVVTRPIAAPAQQSERMRRIGVLMLYPENDSEGQRRATAFQQGLQKLGWGSRPQCSNRFPMGLGVPQILLK